MAESNSPSARASSLPALPSTADVIPYVPVSWVAALAATVAGTFALILFVFGYFALRSRKPLIEPAFLILPVATLVLCFAARRTIQNSEGTRTGILYGVNLVNAAWWTAVILGLCYVAYLFAISFAIRRDAQAEAEKWFVLINTASDEDIARAFYRTLPPGARQAVAPDDAQEMRARFRDDFLTFLHGDLVRLGQRNKGQLNFTTTTVTWNNRPGVIECTLLGTVQCPEGSFPVTIPLRGIEGVTSESGGTGARQWMIERPRGGFVDQSQVTRTTYGWLVWLLEKDGGSFGRGFVDHARFGPSTHPYLYRAFILPGGDRQNWAEVALDPRGVSQLAFAAVIGTIDPTGYRDYLHQNFFRLPKGAEPSPEVKATFMKSWERQSIRPAGDKLKGPDGAPIDKEDILTILENSVEVRVPIEIQLIGKNEVARGRVVVECTHPAVLEILQRHKANAASSPTTVELPRELLNELLELFRDPKAPDRLALPWRVVRVESDMAPVSLSPPGPGMGMPGMDGPGS